MLATALVVGLGAPGCASSRGYDGPGTDHPFVGRSLDEVRPCSDELCGTVGVNLGTIDGTVVRVVDDLSEDQTFSDLACSGDRVDLVVDGDRIVAAIPEDCS